MSYRPQLTTLGFVRSADRSQVLMVHRTRPGDEQFGRYNGLGGKVEAQEDVVSCLIREIGEEAGLQVRAPVLRGTVSWPGFGGEGSDVLGFIFLVDEWSGEPLPASPEGPLSWQPVAGLGELEMWPGDRRFLPLVFDPGVAQFHGVLPYRDRRSVSWRVHIIPAGPTASTGGPR